MRGPDRTGVGGGKLNQVSDRLAMGLSDRYAAFSPLFAPGALDALRSLPTERWVAMVESPAAPLSTRLTAGLLLAVHGDPRLSARQPVMVAIPGGRARLGLAPAAVCETVTRLAETGVLPEWIEKECPEY